MTITVPFVDLKAQYATIRDEIRDAMTAVLEETAFIQGPHVEGFERTFAERLGVAHCVGCSSGTSALTLALEAVGVRPGDEVITVSHTFFATAEAILGLGAVPVFVDVRADTHLMDPEAVASAVTPRTRAIVPVHVYGGPCDMDAIGAIAARHGLKVVEDAAQAHLATCQGRMVGTLGDAACFSFYPGKNLGAYGDAGAVTTADPALAVRMRSMRDHGRAAKYEHDAVGHNHRMDGLQGAILAVKLRHLDGWTEARRRAAALYDRHLGDLGLSGIRPGPGCRPVHHLHVVELPEGIDRGALQAALQAQGIATGVHYPIPCHLQPAIDGRPGSLPVTERLAGRILSLPIYPEITEAQIAHVCRALRDALVPQPA
ncbi:MAG: DegT/DnrJ/EryC1/StrS family aminotransferase [Caulobacter sp.]|nr:DegT/DnrJ/EryC1/StrS family aminotransferase [Caulobacter sp.]